MMKLKGKKRVAIAALSGLMASCIGIGVGLGLNTAPSKVDEALVVSCDEETEFGKKFTFGNTYTIEGTAYTLGSSQDECIDFHTALGVEETDSVTLKSFTLPDGKDGTSDVTDVRHAGTYVFEIQPYGSNAEPYIQTIGVDEKELFIDVDMLPLFVNASTLSATDATKGFTMHGEILTIYHGNTGWFMSKKEGDHFIESKVITNGYCYLQKNTDEATKETQPYRNISIAFFGENLGAATGSTYNNLSPESSTLTINYKNNAGVDVPVTFNIENRTGTTYSASGEYVAAFTFTKPDGYSDYTFTYGDKMSDSYKWLDIVDAGENSFTVTKHWFIIADADFFADQYLRKTNEPYSPFGFGNIYSLHPDEEGADKNDVFTFVDTVTYLEKRNGEGIQVRVPKLVLSGGAAGVTYFSVKYVSEDGEEHILRAYDENGTNEALVVPTKSADGSASVNYGNVNSLAYYFNSSMPAGVYTLTFYGVPTTAGVDRIESEYVLKVLPKAFDEKVKAIYNALDQKAFRYALETRGEGTYPSGLLDLGEESLAAAIAALEDTLEGKSADKRLGFWASEARQDYYDTAVTLLYNRRVWNEGDYVSLADMMGERGSLTSAGEYTFYYSINAKNYVTAGGAGDSERLSRYFTTTLFSAIDDIYNILLQEGSPYFNDVTYTGQAAHTLVPVSSNYVSEFESTVNYVDVGTVHVKLQLTNPNYLGWGDIPKELEDRVWMDDTKLYLYVSYDITPATNSYTLAPTMSPWFYHNFDSTVNLITSTLTFPGAQISYCIGKGSREALTEWLDVSAVENDEGVLEIKWLDSPQYFALDQEGHVPETVAAVLNALPVGTYFVGSYVMAKDENVNGFEQTGSFNAVSVSKTSNRWEITPSMSGWAYQSFGTGSFRAGVPVFNGTIVYKVFEGSNVTSEDKKRAQFNSIGEAEATLNALGVGEYTLYAYLAGGDNYYELDSFVTFSVSQATNTWVTVPTITPWTYGSFTESHFTVGAARHGEIMYAVIRNDASGETVYEDYDYDDMMAAFYTLDAGSYTMRIYVDGTVNYGAVSREVNITVSKAENAWDTAPSIAGWTYGATPSSPSEGTLQNVDKDTPQITYAYYAASAQNEATGNEIVDIGTANAGNYVMVVTVGATTNYNSFQSTYLFTIAQMTTEWDSATQGTNGRQYNWVYAAEDNEDVTRPVIGTAGWATETDAVTYTLTPLGRDALYNGTNWDGLLAALNREDPLTVGTYTLTAHVEGDINHTALDYSVTIVIAQADNAWAEGAAPADSLGKSWAWGSSVQWAGVETKFDTSFQIQIVVVDGQTSTVQIAYVANNMEDLAAQLDNINSTLSRLSVLKSGKYVMIVTASEGVNWKALDASVEFTVNQASNNWVDSPHFSGEDVEEKEEGPYAWDSGTSVSKKYEWDYNSASVTLAYEALHGTVDIVYYSTGSTTPLGGMPVNVGSYWACFSVEPSPDGNYEGIEEFYVHFEIKGILPSELFTVGPKVSSWSWDNYDPATNLFTARPYSGGAVTFEILDEEGETVVEEFWLVDTLNSVDAVHQGSVDLDLYVPIKYGSRNIVSELNDLTEGTYTLLVHVAAYGNYIAYTGNAEIQVNIVQNAWTTIPQIANWAREQWTTALNMPRAAALYGIPHVVITSDASRETLFDGFYYKDMDIDEAEGYVKGYKQDEDYINKLNSADPGWYTMYVTVEGEAGRWTKLDIDSDPVRFQIFIKGTDSTVNIWEVNPSVNWWTANVNADGSGHYELPTGKPLRGKAYFEFYTLVNDDKGLLVGSEEFKSEGFKEGIHYSVVNDDTYAQPFCIPTAPGTYIMYAYAISENEALLEAEPIRFTIQYRTNAWTQSVQISSVLELSEKKNWAAPTATAELSSQEEIRFVYYYKDGREYGSSIPTEAGDYIVRAYASARYSLEISSEMAFTVKLTQNSWVDLPSIEDWSEEFNSTSPDPVGSCEYGNVRIWYLNYDMTERYEKKPTKAGTYYLIVESEYGEAEGYVPLYARYEFTIAPAFDETLVLIDTLLGALASVLTVVAIIFAIRRNREN